MARELGGMIDFVEFVLELGHVLKGHDGQLYTRRVQQVLAWVLAPCMTGGHGGALQHNG